MLSILRKNFIPLLFLVYPVFATQFPARPQGPVADYASIIDAQTEAMLSGIGQSLWQQAGFALIVATIPSIGEESVEEYSTGLYEKWKIGAKGKDEGALIVLAMEQRKIRIEVGYGAEGYLNDARTGRLLDSYGIPYFKKGDFSQGMLSLAVGLARIVEEEKGVSLSIPGGNYRRINQVQTTHLSPFQLILILIVFIVLVSTRFGRSLLFWMLISSLSGSGRRRGGFGGGFGGGGFGGFGGGMSGGGGSSRSF
ncbi:MAG TPA: TPM domain-containing protein [Chitinispirillaceae bacterium]|nr:TPM domain-containing protein [Chitinispirillaceae bacterium]